MSAELKGRCMCGAVSVTMVPAKAELNACHCGMCRRWTGSAFLEIDADPGTLKAEGPVRVFKSSDWAERANCGTCGSPLWYRLSDPSAEFYAVSAGLFDDTGFPLTREIYIDRKPGGFAYAGDHPRITEQEFLASIGVDVEGDAS
ncbi:MAG: GFA family protein [Albidovulum sp.]|uniref:GFA family protein n=1 Tax=Albidovulum sp. TaxID=1872424 RepID=UPI003CABACD2